MSSIITASFFTTVNKIKAKEALKFFLPWHWLKWSNGEYVNKLSTAVKKYVGLKYAVSFYRGREALLVGLKALNIGAGDEVILQAFTCVSVPNAILACGARPVYADIGGNLNLKSKILNLFDYNINPIEIEKKITPRAKAVLVQHTFGLPADMEQIAAVCRRYNLYLIEDCAHALGATYKSKIKNQKSKIKFSAQESKSANNINNSEINKKKYTACKAGSVGDIAIFSFGRDKIISGGAGGLLATNNNQIYQQIKKLFERDSNLQLNSSRSSAACLSPVNQTSVKLSLPVKQVNKIEIFRCLLYEIIFYLGKILYPFYLGKIIVWLAQKLSITPKILNKQEKSGQAEKCAHSPLPNVLAKLAYLDFLQLERYNQKRRQIAEIYYQSLKDMAEIVLPYNAYQSTAVFLRFALQVREPQKLYEYMKKRGVLPANWYSRIIDPAGVDLSRVGYRLRECPQAEQAALGVVNLPAHQNMSLSDARFVMQILKNFYAKK